MDSNVSEFDLIKRYFHNLGPRDESVLVGPSDDCAVILPPSNTKLCCSIDTLVEGVHFPEGTSGAHVATRALGSALSDLAAMGASPSHFTLALTMPVANSAWLNGFASSLAAMADRYGVSLIGGDTTQGPLSVSIQVHGWLPLDKGLMRSGAQPGDLLLVSGSLGDAGGGLQVILSGDDLNGSPNNLGILKDRFYCPQPRLDLGEKLAHVASSCIDISDGLVSDARHLAEASSVCLSVNARLLPISGALLDIFPSQATELALGAGDDYELLFTISPASLALLLERVETPVTVIGRVEEALPGDAGTVEIEGLDMNSLNAGYVHFE